MSDESKDIPPIPAQNTPKSPDIKGSADSKNPPNPPSIPFTEKRPTDSGNPKANKKKINKWKVFERTIRVTEFIAFVAAIATAFFIGYQWREMVKASKVAEGQLQSMDNQWEVMKGQLSEMKKARILDERAWVGVTQAHSVFDATTVSGGATITTGVHFSIEFKNTGRSPAISTIPVVGEYTNVNQIPNPDKFPSPVYHAELLSPQQEGFIPVEVPNPVYTNIYQAIKDGKPFIVAGTIWYDDIFRNHHWTQYCYLIDSQFQCIPQPTHHTCDDAQAQ